MGDCSREPGLTGSGENSQTCGSGVPRARSEVIKWWEEGLMTFRKARPEQAKQANLTLAEGHASTVCPKPGSTTGMTFLHTVFTIA
jgi:hypothetical protein